MMRNLTKRVSSLLLMNAVIMKMKRRKLAEKPKGKEKITEKTEGKNNEEEYEEEEDPGSEGEGGEDEEAEEEKRSVRRAECS
jgi:hypothetical protein